MTQEGEKACPACGSARGRRSFDGVDLRLMTGPEKFPMRECLDCATLFLEPAPAPEDLKRHYPDGYFRKGPTAGLVPRAMEKYRRFVLRGHSRLVARAAGIAGKSPAEAKILDVGAGSTPLAHLMFQKGFKMTCLDISPRAFEAGPGEEEAEIVVAPAERTGLRDSSFDVVALFHSLEHSTDPAAVLREARRILAPRGRLIVEVPNRESLQSRLAGPRWYGLDVPRHAVNFSKKGLLCLLERSGFKPARVRHFCLRDAGPSLVSSFLPGLDPSHRRATVGAQGNPAPRQSAWAGVLYFLLVALAVPLALAEAAAGRGGTVTVEAEKKEAV